MTDLERTILDMLLAGDHATLNVLRGQLAAAEVATREFSGVGFFTKLQVPPSATRLEGRPRLIIGDVYAELSGLQYPVGFLLFITDGALDALECFMHDDEWPDPPPTLVRAYYVHGGPELTETSSRDLESAFENGR